MHGSFIALALVAGIQSVFAQSTSLFIPDTTPQPISADIAGVDSHGHTTWVLHPLASELKGIVGTVTLVEGSDFASMTFADPDRSLTAGLACTISSGQAVCSGSDGDGRAYTHTEAASKLAVQLGATAAVTGTSASNTGSSKNSGSAATATSWGSVLGVAGLLLALL